MLKVRDKTLILDICGQKTIPSADEVFRFVFEQEMVWPNVPVGQASFPEGLKFSRYPALPELVLFWDNASNELCIGLKFRSRGVVLVNDDPDNLDTGHMISSGTWYPLDPSGTDEVRQILTNADAKLGPIKSIKSYIALKKAANEGRSVVDKVEGVEINALSFLTDQFGAPRGIRASLYDYQLSGWRWIRFLFTEGVGGLLADEMGLGKTLQVISAISDPGEEALGTVLIVAPGSILENWRREFAKFAPNIRVLKHHGRFRTGRWVELEEYDVVVTSYETAVRDSSMFLMINWAAVVIDEAQNIKNPDALRTKAIKNLNRGVGLAVTGTPVENNLLDAWSIMDFAIPGYLGDRPSFELDYGNELEGAERLEPLLTPLMLRRRVDDVAEDLPKRIDIPQVIEMTDEEIEGYERLRKSVWAEYGASASLVALTALRIYCCHPLISYDQNLNLDTIDSPTGFSKFQRLHEILTEIIALGEKAIVFTSYTTMADLILFHVRREFDIFAGCIDGRLEIENRQSLIDDFAGHVDPGILVLNPKAGGTGLNITAANHVIHYNLEWNPALEDQASARVYRRGQMRPVTVHRLFLSETVEEVIDERLTRKRDLIGASVVGVTGGDNDYQDIIKALQCSPILTGKKGI